MRTIFLTTFFAFSSLFNVAYSQFSLNKLEYFENEGVNVMAFQDIYPEGHQGGVAIIMHNVRVATNGDMRLDEAPGQWQPKSKQHKRLVGDKFIETSLSYPDSAINGKGFNPINYPDLYFNYKVTTRYEGSSVIVTVDLDRPIPDSFIGKVGFNMELFPGCYFGKTWYLGNKSGIFAPQVNGPGMFDKNGKLVAASPMAEGTKIAIAPDDSLIFFTIETKKGSLQLIDGRYQHNNGWFTIRNTVAAGVTKNAIEWVITPNVVSGWKSDPVIHVSQIGYYPAQKKQAIIELDKHDKEIAEIELFRIGEDGNNQLIAKQKPVEWGEFLRYNYLKYDFSNISKPGMYRLKYGKVQSQPFQISNELFDRNVWQPVLEYFLPVQMCHMRINEKYRVWHGLCHMDDALMAPINYNHFDGYMQGPSTYTKFKPGEHVDGLNTGGWHDAGDYDLRVESQCGEAYILSQIFEEFKVNYDETTIDQKSRIVEIHQPDGKPDMLQQIEHGALAVIAGYKNMGKIYRGIICSDLRQYVLLGDGSTMTDGLVYNKNLKPGELAAGESSAKDDQWVFTEDNPGREITTAAQLSAVSRVLKGYNDTLSHQCLDYAIATFQHYQDNEKYKRDLIQAAIELYLTTNDNKYSDYLLKNRETIIKEFRWMAGMVAKVIHKVQDKAFIDSIDIAANKVAADIASREGSTPFGVPYRPHIWGAGWDIQSFGVKQYYLHKAFPGKFSAESMLNALNFILGVHPGSNTASFASGVGVRSTTVAYGVNRADWSYIPGGVSSGTSLIRPDFPELLDFPYLWQQQEYVMGGGSSNFMFLVLAAQKMFVDQQREGLK